MAPRIELETSKTENQKNDLAIMTWQEIRDNKKWIVIDDVVYDVAKFSQRHPGGEELVLNHSGQDATVKKIDDDKFHNTLV